MVTINPRNIQPTICPDGKAIGYYTNVDAIAAKREGSLAV